ncbi:DnaJ domain-containing protein [Vibrio neonatus]|uniref:DnaJ domain-containing protein n=1 Tax=Vibrio neonatus TaxID=278860 RepID=UPI0021C40EF9|nr:DnaJ domain-containing protein [Vibrio neonatus]
MNDYYEILGISIDANSRDIKQAYKKKALKWHPDRNSSIEAKKKMLLVNEAYLILSDEESRNKYDIEYRQYKNFKDLSSKSNEEYVYSDDVLAKWMNNAKIQASYLAKKSLDDLIGISGVAGHAFWNHTKKAIIIYSIIMFLIVLFMYNS